MATETKPKHKRRWFRFSLKTFVVLLTVFCVWLGLMVHRVNKQKEAVQWVKGHGGQVLYDFQSDHHITLLDLADDTAPPVPDWLRELIGIDYFTDVVFVDLNDTKVEDIEPLRDLSQLQVLSLDRTQVMDFEPLRELTRLQTLSLGSTQVSDLEPLRKLTQLWWLTLNGTQVSDLSPLRELTQLLRLHLDAYVVQPCSSARLEDCGELARPLFDRWPDDVYANS